MSSERDELHLFHLVLFLSGGLLAGFGVLNLAWAWGIPDPANPGGHIPLNSDFALTGFSGLDNVQLLPSADFAIPMVVAGVCCLVLANATAWKETQGY